MKKHVKKVSLFAFLFSSLLLVASMYADAVSFDSVSSFYIATNSNVSNAPNNLTATKIVKPDAWYRSSTGLWYYFENNWTTTKTGWFVDPYDGQTFYLNPVDGIMAVGWTTIDGNEYFFKDKMDEEENRVPLGLGFYVSVGKGKKSYGSLYKDCMTPDGKMVDETGKLIK